MTLSYAVIQYVKMCTVYTKQYIPFVLIVNMYNVLYIITTSTVLFVNKYTHIAVRAILSENRVRLENSCQCKWSHSNGNPPTMFPTNCTMQTALCAIVQSVLTVATQLNAQLKIDDRKRLSLRISQLQTI